MRRLGLLQALTCLAALGASTIAAQSSQYGVVFGTGYNAITQYFNKNSTVAYVDGSCLDFFTIVLGLNALNTTGPTGNIFYRDLDSGVVLAKSELLPQGSISKGGPSYSIANVTKLKTWRLPQTYSKVIAVFHSNETDTTASSANAFDISFAGQSATVPSTFAQVTVSLGIPTFGACDGFPRGSQLKKDFAGLDPFHRNNIALLNPIATPPAPSPGQAVNVSRVVITAVLTKYNLTTFTQDLQRLYIQKLLNVTGVRQVDILRLRSGSVLIDTAVFVETAFVSSFLGGGGSFGGGGASGSFDPEGPLGPVTILDPTGGSSSGCSITVRFRVFIPTAVVFVSDPFGILKYTAFNGNDRTFCYDCGTSKADVQTTFTVQPADLSAIASAGPGTGAFDTTEEYNVADTAPLPGGPFWAGQLKTFGAVPKASKQLQRTPDNLYIQPSSPTALHIHVDGSVPLFTVFGYSSAPAINADITVTFDSDSNGYVEYAVSGSHDGFPAYELYINEQLIYSYDPIAQGASPFALAPPEDVTINVPTTILFDTNARCGCARELNTCCDGTLASCRCASGKASFLGRIGFSCVKDCGQGGMSDCPGSIPVSYNVYCFTDQKCLDCSYISQEVLGGPICTSMVVSCSRNASSTDCPSSLAPIPSQDTYSVPTS